MLPKCVSRIADIQTMHWPNIESGQNLFNKENKPRKGTRNETSNIITRRNHHDSSSSTKVAYQVLLIPATDASVDTESYNEFATGRFLPRAFMKYGWDLYAPDDGTRNNPCYDPIWNIHLV